MTITIRDNSPQAMYFKNAKDWVFRLSEKGIEFNREAFPDHKPEDFAREFMEIIENSYNVKFEKK
jgi:hypothetical protein